jgi:HPt (histidine-containing phosphotransfer) domain-containing protein
VDDITSTIPVSDSMFDRLVPYFVSRLSVHELELTSLVQRMDIKPLGILLHQLKGSCTAFGFPSLGTIALQMEESLSSAPVNTTKLQELLREFTDHCHAIHAGFNHQMSCKNSTPSL